MMCGAGTYLHLAGVSTLVVAVVLHSRCDVLEGLGTSLFTALCYSLFVPEGQLSSCGTYSTLVLAFGLLSSCVVLQWSSLIVLCLGRSSLVVEWELLSCCIMLCGSSLAAVCWLISICCLRGYSLGVVWSLLSRCGV